MNITGFRPSHRGAGLKFGPDALNEFLENNQLSLMVRSHETCHNGINWPFTDKPEYMNTCITVFSCCFNNTAGVITISSKLEISYESFSPLTPEQAKKRRILLPVWMTSDRKKHPVLLRNFEDGAINL